MNNLISVILTLLFVTCSRPSELMLVNSAEEFCFDVYGFLAETPESVVLFRDIKPNDSITIGRYIYVPKKSAANNYSHDMYRVIYNPTKLIIIRKSSLQSVNDTICMDSHMLLDEFRSTRLQMNIGKKENVFLDIALWFENNAP